MGGDDDDPDLGPVVLDPAKHIHAVHSRHFQVQEHQTELLPLEASAALLRR